MGYGLSPADGLLLYERAPLGYLGALANHVRERKHGDRTYFNRNFHVEPTNVCLYTCSFCSYSRRMKKREDGWEYGIEDIMDIVKKYDDQAVTEVHIVGGVLPQYDVPFYTELFQRIRAHRPDLHIKALTPVEYHYIFKKAKISYEEGMRPHEGSRPPEYARRRGRDLRRRDPRPDRRWQVLGRAVSAHSRDLA